MVRERIGAWGGRDKNVQPRESREQYQPRNDERRINAKEAASATFSPSRQQHLAATFAPQLTDEPSPTTGKYYRSCGRINESRYKAWSRSGVGATKSFEMWIHAGSGIIGCFHLAPASSSGSCNGRRGLRERRMLEHELQNVNCHVERLCDCS